MRKIIIDLSEVIGDSILIREYWHRGWGWRRRYWTRLIQRLLGVRIAIGAGARTGRRGCVDLLVLHVVDGTVLLLVGVVVVVLIGTLVIVILIVIYLLVAVYLWVNSILGVD